MMRRSLLLASLLTAPAMAQTPPEAWRPEPVDMTVYVTPQIPDEATKTWALKRAYQLNGGVMDGKMIDVSKEQPLAIPVKLQHIAATPTPTAVDKPVDSDRGLSRPCWCSRRAQPNTCTLHHRRIKVSPMAANCKNADKARDNRQARRAPDRRPDAEGYD